MRGEYSPPANGSCGPKELPPRARRILAGAWFWYCMMGTTSACAENTAKRGSFFLAIGNYLRVRGEYQPLPLPARPAAELPPRARRIHLIFFPKLFLNGTTSACAENTGCIGIISVLTWNYLRVRGEYLPSLLAARHTSELPPRARRILTGGFGFLGFEGTTSACAENTSFPRLQQRLCKNYLRVRGEYAKFMTRASAVKELPPRARRIHATMA